MKPSQEQAQAGVDLAIHLSAQFIAAAIRSANDQMRVQIGRPGWPARWAVVLGDISLDGLLKPDGQVLIEGEPVGIRIEEIL